MSEEKKSKKNRDGVEKKHKREQKKDKKDRRESNGDSQVKTAEAAFSLLADEKAANPALTALFAAKVLRL